MDNNFWHRRWEKNEISFHQSEAHPLLVKYFSELSLAKGSRVFVPLCGKTRDISWLLAMGYRVAGVELSKIAIEQLFADLGLRPEIREEGELVGYHADKIDIFVGDLFSLSGKRLGPVDAIYDRAAFVALTKEMRNRYASHLMEISNKAAQLLICCGYDQGLMEGPPFSISSEEVHQNYRNYRDVSLLESAEIAGGLKGAVSATEDVWLLR